MDIKQVKTLEELQKLHTDTFGKNGTMTLRLKGMKDLNNDARAALNTENTTLREAFRIRQEELENSEMLAVLAKQKLDAAAPVEDREQKGQGQLHPLTYALYEFTNIFESMGYGMRSGPEIEDDWHNFGALNFPDHHPARDMHDTFFLQSGDILRTHTSTVQIRAMDKEGVPIKVFAPGTTYRTEMDATHTPMFHQLEWLHIDKNVTAVDLVDTIKTFLSLYFGTTDMPLRLRPSYFPFTEPSLEFDMQWDKKTGVIGTGKDWLEVGGCGVVHPNVLKNVGVDPALWQGHAGGPGFDRMIMLKYGFNDLREFFKGDIRWLKTNGFSIEGAE
ncbi:MAG: phenylalanine--tRNA ligase subunit alpha [Alphaproteobacteria bacterium]|nr:phenylalanine--tRNA ligase subunit alpha [Alphaproteobacteria bacterium]